MAADDSGHPSSRATPALNTIFHSATPPRFADADDHQTSTVQESTRCFTLQDPVIDLWSQWSPAAYLNHVREFAALLQPKPVPVPHPLTERSPPTTRNDNFIFDYAYAPCKDEFPFANNFTSTRFSKLTKQQTRLSRASRKLLGDNVEASYGDLSSSDNTSDDLVLPWFFHEDEDDSPASSNPGTSSAVPEPCSIETNQALAEPRAPAIVVASDLVPSAAVFPAASTSCLHLSSDKPPSELSFMPLAAVVPAPTGLTDTFTSPSEPRPAHLHGHTGNAHVFRAPEPAMLSSTTTFSAGPHSTIYVAATSEPAADRSPTTVLGRPQRKLGRRKRGNGHRCEHGPPSNTTVGRRSRSLAATTNKHSQQAAFPDKATSAVLAMSAKTHSQTGVPQGLQASAPWLRGPPSEFRGRHPSRRSRPLPWPPPNSSSPGWLAPSRPLHQPTSLRYRFR